MSTYGRLWEQLKGLRSMLRAHLPALGEYATLAEAEALAAALKPTKGIPLDVSVLLGRWAELERQMARCDDHTGEPR